MPTRKQKTQYLQPDEIAHRAMAALTQYTQRYGARLPVRPEVLLETEYNMRIIPIAGLKSLGIECSFSRGGSTILVDQGDYENENLTCRLSFTFAHELGHKILHEHYLGILDELGDEEFEWLEKQARMFAASFLMPETILLGVIASEIIERYESIASTDLTLEQCIDYRLPNLARYFGVSIEAMKNRINNLDLRKIMTGPYISHADKDKIAHLSKAVEKAGKNEWAISPLFAKSVD